MHILIADDDRATTVMLARTLEAWGLNVTVASDGKSAWAHIIGKDPPALAIVDWDMPGIDGVELCRRVRAWPLRVPLYLILLTSRTSRQDMVVGLEGGADDYMTKPFDPDELRARIHVGRRTLALIASVKQLRGLLPICSYCKRIRSDHDYWVQVESYITDHTEVQFSHSVCPDCYVTAQGEVPRSTSVT